MALDQDSTEEILAEFMGELEAMGYSQNWREQVLKASISGYMRILKKAEDGICPRNRLGADSMMNRR